MIAPDDQVDVEDLDDGVELDGDRDDGVDVPQLGRPLGRPLVSLGRVKGPKRGHLWKLRDDATAVCERCGAKTRAQLVVTAIGVRAVMKRHGPQKCQQGHWWGWRDEPPAPWEKAPSSANPGASARRDNSTSPRARSSSRSSARRDVTAPASRRSTAEVAGKPSRRGDKTKGGRKVVTLGKRSKPSTSSAKRSKATPQGTKHGRGGAAPSRRGASARTADGRGVSRRGDKRPGAPSRRGDKATSADGRGVSRRGDKKGGKR